MKKYIIDRFEENFAVLEKEECGTIDVERNLIPEGKEGDVVIFENGNYRVDSEETAKRKELIKEKMRKLFTIRQDA